MEALKQTTEPKEFATEHEEGGARDVLRGIARRRLERKGTRALKRGKRRVRAFGRGAAVGYAIQENPARATAIGFLLGCFVGAVGLGIVQVLGDFQTLMEEESPEENETPQSKAA